MTASSREHSQIRQARANDAEGISSVLRVAFAEFEPRYTRSAFAATTPTPDGVLERMNEGPIWVVEHGGGVIGTASVLLEDVGVYIRGMAVHPGARGKGVARRLMERIEAFAIAQGRSRLFLSTTPFLSEAIRLYERHGFRRIQEGPDELFGTPLFTMEKLL